MITAMHELLKQNKEIWDLFTRAEEYSPKRLDEHDKFTYALSSHPNILEPESSKFLTENGLRIEYPGNKRFAICLTHDVDEVYPPFSHMVLSSLYYMKGLDFKGLKKQLFWKKKGEDSSPYRNFKAIMKLEENYGAKSSFYFMATSRDIKRFRYNVEDLTQDLGFIVDKGWEVGLHGGYYAYNSLEEMKREKKRLEKVLGREVIGYRNHYLRFKVPDTWELLGKAGFKYDTTFGYGDTVGFRNGMCHPFRPYNLNSHSQIDIMEIPLHIMDVTLKVPNGIGLGLDFTRSWEITKRLIDITEKYRGVLTVLFHNEVFSCPFKQSFLKLYEDILKYGRERNAWMTSGEEIWRYFRCYGF